MRKILCFCFGLVWGGTFWTCDELVSKPCELTVQKGQIVIKSIPVTYWRYRARQKEVESVKDQGINEIMFLFPWPQKSD